MVFKSERVRFLEMNDVLYAQQGPVASAMNNDFEQ